MIIDILGILALSGLFILLAYTLVTHKTPTQIKMKNLRAKEKALEDWAHDRAIYEKASGMAYAVGNYPLGCLRDYEDLVQEILALSLKCSKNNPYAEMTARQVNFVHGARKMAQLRGMPYHPIQDVAAACATLRLNEDFTAEQLEEAIERHRRVANGVNPRIQARHTEEGEAAYALLKIELAVACTWADFISGKKPFPHETPRP